MAKSMLGQNLLRADLVVNYTALTEASTTSTQTIATLPKGAVVVDAFFDVVAPLADAGSISAVTCKIGPAASTAAYMAATSVFDGTATAGTRYATATTRSTHRVLSSATAVLATFAATGANFGDGSTTGLDSGAVRATVLYHILPLAA
tara:strand:+ start:113 stop:556 length:444 start_codon:yes stop_codon:yes gene_type:complete